MTFSKKDLSGNYTWALGSRESVYTGTPSRRNFDRYSGDQVLFIINSLADSNDSFSLDDVKKVEQAIIDKLPISTLSEISAFNWLKLYMESSLISL